MDTLSMNQMEQIEGGDNEWPGGTWCFLAPTIWVSTHANGFPDAFSEMLVRACWNS